jgi:PAS domain S-box-containing protein
MQEREHQPSTPHSNAFRPRAEELAHAIAGDVAVTSATDGQPWGDDLPVHARIESELQKEELRRTQAELAEARDRYRDLYEFAPVAYLTLDDAQVVREANLTAATMFGVERDRLEGFQFATFVAPSGRDACYLDVQAVLTSASKRASELAFVRADGSEFFGRLEIAPIETRQSVRKGCWVTISDITEHRQAEALKRSNRDLTEFASITSHDLLEPLRVVNSFLKLLQDRYAPQLDAQAKEYIGYAVDSANRMSDLIRDLLAYSRVDRKSGNVGPVEAGDALTTALANLQAGIQEANAQITRDPLPTVMADQTQLTQLFQNLVGNAIKFRRQDQPCLVHIGTDCRGQQVVLFVRDNGIGIPPEHYNGIFEIFRRLHAQSKYPGTGVGLAICKRIVERHGGRIWVESKPGEGSTFYCSLPSPGM